MKYQVGTQFTYGDRVAQHCTVVDTLRAYNLDGERVRLRYVVSYQMCGLTQTRIVEERHITRNLVALGSGGYAAEPKFEQHKTSFDVGQPFIHPKYRDDCAVVSDVWLIFNQCGDWVDREYVCDLMTGDKKSSRIHRVVHNCILSGIIKYHNLVDNCQLCGYCINSMTR